MKYFNVPALNRSITQLTEYLTDKDGTFEHRTSRATLGLIRNYFPVDKFTVTSEQMQEFTRKKNPSAGIGRQGELKLR